MRPGDEVQLIVETEGTVRLIRFHGPADRSGMARLLRLIDAQLDLVEAGRATITDVIVDLDGASSYDPGGLQTLRHARYSAGTRGIGFHLTGLAARVPLMPLNARQVVGDFSTFPTIEIALTALCPTPTDTHGTIEATQRQPTLRRFTAVARRPDERPAGTAQRRASVSSR